MDERTTTAFRDTFTGINNETIVEETNTGMSQQQRDSDDFSLERIVAVVRRFFDVSPSAAERLASSAVAIVRQLERVGSCIDCEQQTCRNSSPFANCRRIVDSRTAQQDSVCRTELSSVIGNAEVQLCKTEVDDGELYATCASKVERSMSLRGLLRERRIPREGAVPSTLYEGFETRERSARFYRNEDCIYRVRKRGVGVSLAIRRNSSNADSFANSRSLFHEKLHSARSLSWPVH